jgi:hypothetical protein
MSARALPPRDDVEAEWIMTADGGYPTGVLRTRYGAGNAWRTWLLDDRYEFLGSFDSPQAARRALRDRHWLTRGLRGGR